MTVSFILLKLGLGRYGSSAIQFDAIHDTGISIRDTYCDTRYGFFPRFDTIRLSWIASIRKSNICMCALWKSSTSGVSNSWVGIGHIGQIHRSIGPHMLIFKKTKKNLKILLKPYLHCLKSVITYCAVQIQVNSVTTRWLVTWCPKNRSRKIQGSRQKSRRAPMKSQLCMSALTKNLAYQFVYLKYKLNRYLKTLFQILMMLNII